MQLDCIAVLKEGVEWEEVYTLAHTIAMNGLLSIGILKGIPHKILEARTSTAFMPHGLGHFLGMDTHNVDNNPNKDEKTCFLNILECAEVFQPEVWL